MKKFALLSAMALAVAAAAGATTINVTYSEDFAEELVEEYGEREGNVLSEDVIEDLEFALDRAGVDPARIDVVIVRAKPNHPTREQVRAQPGLDPIRSISIGGMTLEGAAYDAEGNEIATVEYDWYETDIRNVAPAGTWWDANRASRNFARRMAEAVSEN